MRRIATLPFELTREQSVIGAEVTTTSEEIHGLLYLAADRIRVQWRVAREVSQVGTEIRTDRVVGQVHEADVLLAGVAGADLRRRWWSRLGLPGGFEFVLRAADLRAFEAVAGASGLELEHPAELVIPVRPADRLNAQEFAAELALAVAEHSLAAHSVTAHTIASKNPPSGTALPSGDSAAGEPGVRVLPPRSRGAV